jgi:hypothetical protein
MTLTYTTNIPNPPNDPADDVSIMQTNTNSIASFVAVDHIAFGVGSSVNGQHKQVTFATNNVPVVPTSPPVLFTNTVGSLPQLLFYSGNATQSSSQYVLRTSPGSTFLFGGMIIKWGTYTILAGNPNQAVNFTSAFPTAVVSIVITCTAFNGGNVPGDLLVNYTSASASGFTGQRINAPATSANYNYIAIGY